jgi:ankyrin repeat protein
MLRATGAPEVDRRNAKHGRTALFLGAQYGRTAVVRLLLEVRPVCCISNSVIHRGPARCAADRVLDGQAGASVKLESEHGENSLDVALRKGHTETANVLRAEQTARALFTASN